jgi:hypothetical protein
MYSSPMCKLPNFQKYLNVDYLDQEYEEYIRYPVSGYWVLGTGKNNNLDI